ncbi:MAG TPA: ribonuclease HII [Nitrososphaera sp.]
MLIGGVDEAGRGSILGPLVVAGVSVRQSRLARLKEMGVRDSKLLTPQARARLVDEIKSVADRHYVHAIDIAEIDKSVLIKGLNRLEAKAMAHVISHLRADEVYVDCCDTNPERYRNHIASHLEKSPTIHSLHHADKINVAVSAASILAKVERDLTIQKLRKKHRNIGSGYPSDEKTMLFIRNWVMRKNSAPVFARKSWKPMRLLLEELEQRTLV